MPVIAITNGLYTGSEKIVQALGEEFDCTVVRDIDLIEKTRQTHKIKLATLRKVMESKQIAFNNFTHEREKCISALKKVISDLVGDGNCIFHGFLSHLIPREITHVMRVLIVEEKKTRIEQGMASDNVSKKEAAKRLNLSDKHASSWTMSLLEKNPWDETLYDKVVPLSKSNPKTAVHLVSEYFKTLAGYEKNLIKQEVLDFRLSADVDLALSDFGRGLLVKSSNGHVVVTIDKKVKMLTKFQQKIIQAVEVLPGVITIKTRIGKNYYS